MLEKKFAVSQSIGANEIKNLRKQLKLTQKEFAELVHCSKATVERWERDLKPITGPIVLLVKLLREQTGLVEKLQIPIKVYPIRLWYMHEQTPCTVIDVDECNRQIKIKNFVDNVIFRAFGTVENPDYQMYTQFLISRCFPESRDKMKLILKDLDLPFYDPFMIVEKTQGRMAEDHFWVKIER